MLACTLLVTQSGPNVVCRQPFGLLSTVTAHHFVVPAVGLLHAHTSTAKGVTCAAADCELCLILSYTGHSNQLQLQSVVERAERPAAVDQTQRGGAASKLCSSHSVNWPPATCQTWQRYNITMR